MRHGIVSKLAVLSAAVAGSGSAAERNGDAAGEAAQPGGRLPAAEQHPHGRALQGSRPPSNPIQELRNPQHSSLLLSQLCTQIEQLEQENRGLKEVGGATADPASSPVDGELLRLQAENATLQKKMRGVCCTPAGHMAALAVLCRNPFILL